MASFSRKTGVIGALAIAGVLIGGAYILSSAPSIFAPKTANAESTQQLLQAYAQKDSDNDGLPDWQEALYGTDPNNAHSFSPTLTDGQAVAQGLIKPKFQAASVATSTIDADTSDIPGIAAASGSLTDQFAQQFFSQYISQQDGDTQPTADDIDSYATNAMQAFVAANVQSDPYTVSQVRVQGSGQDALNAYLADDEKVIAANAVQSDKNEVEYFSDAVEKNDSSALKELAIIGKAYTSISPQLMSISVPVEAQQAHLELANATSRLGVDITDMSLFQSDPLRAYIGLEQYQNDVNSFAKAFVDLHAVLTTYQVNIPSGNEGYFMLMLTSNIASSSSPH